MNGLSGSQTFWVISLLGQPPSTASPRRDRGTKAPLCRSRAYIRAYIACLALPGLLAPSLAQIAPLPPSSLADDNSNTAKCQIGGVITSAVTGGPISKATLRLQKAAAVVTAASVSEGGSVAESDVSGKFVFQNVEPGAYLLSASRAGFTRQRYGARHSNSPGTVLTLSAGQQMKGMSLRLVPEAKIAGKVIEEDGEAVTTGGIQTLRIGYVAGRKQLLPAGMATINADGSFVVAGLAAGQYYIKATPGSPMVIADQLNDESSRKVTPDAYIATYYPNAEDSSRAAPISVSPGAEIRGLQIRLLKSPVFRLRGKVQSPQTGVSVQGLMLALMPNNITDLSSLFDRRLTLVRNSTGSFDFGRIPSGAYIIQTVQNMATPQSPPAASTSVSRPLSGRYVINVAEHDVEDVIVPLVPGIDITGTIRIEEAGQINPVQDPNSLSTGSPAATSAGSGQRTGLTLTARPFVKLQPVDHGLLGNVSTVQSGQDGEFSFSGVPPNTVRVTLAGLPDGTYVKSIRHAGQEILGTTLDLASGLAGKIEVTLSSAAGDVSGVLLDPEGHALAGIVVSLWERSTANTSDFARTATSDQNGAFHFGNLAPNDYSVIAWEEIEPGLALNPELCRHFQSEAASVTIGAESHASIEVKVIGREAVDVAAANIR